MKTIHSFPVKTRKKRNFLFLGKPIYVPLDSKTGRNLLSGGILEEESIRYLEDKPVHGSTNTLLFIKDKPKSIERAGIMLKELQKARAAKNKIRVAQINEALKKMPWIWRNKFAIWDEHAKEGWQYVHPAEKEAIGNELRRHAKGNVLDVGAGSWNYFGKGGGKTDAPKVKEVIAMDGSRENLARNPNEKRLWANLTEVGKRRLPFANASFETINMAFVMNYLPISKAMLSEYDRVLKKGGKMLICGSENLGLKQEERHKFDPVLYGGLFASMGYSTIVQEIRSTKEKDLFLLVATKRK
ncbi:MAG: class I SAM-dependent methyltransferase [archaeon]